MSISKLFISFAAIVLLTFSFNAFGAAPKVVLEAGETGRALADSTVVAKEGSTVYVKTGSVVLYWPGSILVKSKDAQASVDCSSFDKTAKAGEDLFVVDNSTACANADSVVVAEFGSTIIYEDGVDLVRRPVVRRHR